MNRAIQIKGREIGPGQPLYIVAELSANHGQDFDRAARIIRAAKEAGADAIKTQTYTADTLTLPCRNEHFRIGKGTIWEGRTLYDLYLEAATPWEWQPKLKALAEEAGLDFFSTPFDDSSVDFLESLGVPAYKIASFENVDLPLLRRVARTGKPVLISTGMASLAEIDEAVRTLRGAGCPGMALLLCTSAYPAAPDEMNLRTIPHMAEAFDAPIGLSDHTLDLAVPVAAVALGACILEKHLTLHRSDPGPDSSFSLEPSEFAEMVKAARTAHRALGAVFYGLRESEQASRVFRRSLFVVRPVKKGEAFAAENVRSIRPGFGLHPRYLENVLGRHATRDIEPGTPLAWELVG